MNKKVIFVLDLGYNKKISNLTYPYIINYSKKINADLIIFTERYFLEYPIEVEKFQIYNYKNKYDWYIYIDLDTLIHPDIPDLTELMAEDVVLFADVNFCGNTYKLNNYFRRDGRFIQAGNWFSICSNLTIDLWNPNFEWEEQEIIDMISLTNNERLMKMKKEHLVDEFLVSNNIAKYGIKVETLKDILVELQIEKDIYLFHNYLLNGKEKEKQIKKLINEWRI